MLVWKQKNTTYSNGESGYAGKVRLFSVDYDSCRNKDSGIPPYKLTSTLPQTKADLGHYETPEEAKERAERILASWLTAIGVRGEA